MEYADLMEYDTIYQLLPNKKSFCVILTQYERNIGHFTTILRYVDDNGFETFEWFDSLGGRTQGEPDGETKQLSNSINGLFGQDKPVITDLFRTAKPKAKLVYNDLKLQQNKEGVNTCGRWCILRIIAMMKYNYDYDDFIKYIKTETKKCKCSNDELVSRIIP